MADDKSNYPILGEIGNDDSDDFTDSTNGLLEHFKKQNDVIKSHMKSGKKDSKKSPSFDHLHPEDQKSYAEYVDNKIVNNPEELAHWSKWGFPGITGEYIKRKHFPEGEEIGDKQEILDDNIQGKQDLVNSGTFQSKPDVGGSTKAPLGGPQDFQSYTDSHPKSVLPNGMPINDGLLAFLRGESSLQAGVSTGSKVGQNMSSSKRSMASSTGAGPSVGAAEGKDLADASVPDDRETIKDAQERSAKARLVNELGRAGELIGSGIAHTNPMGQKIFTEQAKDSDSIVDAYKERVADQKNDPNSQVSKQFREYAKQYSPNIPANTTAADGEKLFPYMFKHFETEQHNAFLDKELKQKIGAQAQAHSDNMELKRAMLDDKNTKNQEKGKSQAVKDTMTLLETNRGNNPEVSQAYKDRYAAGKALSLIDKYDPDALSTQQIQMITSELGKVMQGGVPTHDEMKALTPDTLKTRFAKFKTLFTGNPSPAEAGEFVKQYKSYLTDLNSGANKVIHTKMGRVLESKKKDLGDENYDLLKKQYLDSEFENQTTNSGNKKDEEAIAWAKNNPKDADAQKILRLHGIK